MSFTYRADLTTDRDKVRFHIQDTVEDAGPKPGDGNFSDEELDGLITVAGSWERAVSAAFRALAAAWRRYPDFKADGLTLKRSDIADGYERAAIEWEKRHGIVKPVAVAGLIRVDGYSGDVASDDVDTGGDYQVDFEYIQPERGS